MIEKPPIVATPLNTFFWEAARREKLVIQRCEACRRYVHPPLPLCPECGGGALAPERVSGKGVVESFTIVRRVFHPGFAEDVPYVVARIELDEQPGLVLITNVKDIPVEAVRIGLRVEVMFEHRPDGVLPQFRPAERAQ